MQNGLIALCALFMGYSIGRWQAFRKRKRCHALRHFAVTLNEGGVVEMTRRCELEPQHDGPHEARIGGGYTPSGQCYWHDEAEEERECCDQASSSASSA